MTQRLVKICAFLLASVTLLITVHSLFLPLQSDTPIMLYFGKMVADGAVPYRDFLDMNMPGSYLFFAAIVKFFGVSRIAAMSVNLAVCLLAALAFYFAFNRFGRLFAFISSLLLLLRLFIVQGHIFTLEREVIAMPLVGLIVWLPLCKHSSKSYAWLLLGFLSALLFLIKPQFVLFAIPPAIFMLQNNRWTFKGVFLAGIAFLLPCVLSLYWLLSNGAWEGLKQWAQYTPLYGGMDYTLSYGNTPLWKLRSTLRLANRFLICTPYTILALAGLASAWFRSSLTRRQIVFFASLLFVSVIVSSFSGQLWGYHRIPYFAFALFCASLLVKGGKLECAGFSAFMLAVCGIAVASFLGYRDIDGQSVMRQKTLNGVSNFLSKNLKSGEKVQPDDWAHEMLNSMLRVNAPLATRFPYTFYFYHNVSSPVIKKMRQDFLAELRNGNARYIIRAKQCDHVNGFDTEKTWQEYEDFLATHCKIAEETDEYVIYDCQIHSSQ